MTGYHRYCPDQLEECLTRQEEAKHILLGKLPIQQVNLDLLHRRRVN